MFHKITVNLYVCTLCHVLMLLNIAYNELYLFKGDAPFVMHCCYVSKPHFCLLEAGFSMWSVRLNSGSLPINPLNTELNPICHLLALLVAPHILHVSRISVKVVLDETQHRCVLLYQPNIVP
jgi:hypothetical protein